MSVTTIDDSLVEGEETFSLVLSNPRPSADVELGAPASATGRILDDDLPAVRVSDGSGTEPVEGLTSEMHFEVTLSEAATTDVTVQWETVGDPAADPPTAAEGGLFCSSEPPPDYMQESAGTVRIEEGNLGPSGPIVVLVCADSDTTEGDETFVVLLTEAEGATVDSSVNPDADRVGVGTIRASGPPEVWVKTPDPVAENAGPMDVRGGPDLGVGRRRCRWT